MSAREFVARIREDVIESNLRSYGDMLAMSASSLRDPKWRAIAVAYQRMDEEQKAAIAMLVRQVVIDTISNVFGILDGSSLIEGFRERFVLQYGFRDEKLNGDLQELLLAAEE
jgi:hypothetical protein